MTLGADSFPPNLNTLVPLIPDSIIQGQMTPDPTVDNTFLFIHRMSTTDAFTCIGNVLKLGCQQTFTVGFHVRELNCNLPPAMVPTTKQLLVQHKPYVDMIPWPSMRDKILESVVPIDELQLIGDFLAGDLQVWGSTPWDLMGWEIGPRFAKKWCFLIDEGMILTTNYWRSQRGEQPLALATLCIAAT